MFNTFVNAWKLPDIRKKILFTLLMLFVYRIGAFVPVPGTNVDYVAQQVARINSVLGFLNLLSGGALGNLTIFALGIVPYVNASIIMQLLDRSHSITGANGQRKARKAAKRLRPSPGTWALSWA